jgi:hypothetical protein
VPHPPFLYSCHGIVDAIVRNYWCRSRGVGFKDVPSAEESWIACS